MKRKLGAALLCALMLGSAGAEWTDGLMEDDFTEAEYLVDEPEAEEESAPTVAPPEKIILLKSGSSGAEVRTLQLRLIELGYLSEEADGEFGPATKEAVSAFQRRNDLSVDGMAGKQTQGKLYSPEAAAAPAPAEPTDMLAGEWPLLTNLDHPVEENFLPADLVLMKEICPEEVVHIKYENTQGVRTAVEALEIMLEAARAEGLGKWQVSAGYRSWAEQESMLNYRINTYLKKNSGWSRGRARRAALQTVAEPGASEHHLGLSFDVNVRGADNFASTKQCKWLHAHCWEYGFIIRYQKGKEKITGFAPEAWHVRYVGARHSLIMRDEDLCLEEYMEKYYPEGIQ